MSARGDHAYDDSPSVRLGPFTIRLERRPRRSTWRSPLAITAAASLLALLVLAAPAEADTSASVTASVSVMTRSVSASPSSFTFNKCFYPNNQPKGPFTLLPIPNGNCGVSPDPYAVSLTFGAAASDLAMSATSFVPSDGGTPWALCAATGRADLPACTGPLGSNSKPQPGLDEARLNLSSARSPQGADISAMPDCPWIASRCVEIPNGRDDIWPVLYGPNATTDNSPTFSSVITFYALPAS